MKDNRYAKIIFTDSSKEKEWEDIPKRTKDFAWANLSSMAKNMESKVAIEMLCHVVNDLIKRIEDLENPVPHAEL